MAGAGGSLRAGVTDNPVRLTESVKQRLVTRVTGGGAPVYVWPGGGITYMVDVTRCRPMPSARCPRRPWSRRSNSRWASGLCGTRRPHGPSCARSIGPRDGPKKRIAGLRRHRVGLDHRLARRVTGSPRARCGTPASRPSTGPTGTAPPSTASAGGQEAVESWTIPGETVLGCLRLRAPWPAAAGGRFRPRAVRSRQRPDDALRQPGGGREGIGLQRRQVDRFGRLWVGTYELTETEPRGIL